MVGGSLLLGVAFSVLLGAGGVLNPAVAYALQLFSPMYILGPIFGSLLGFNLYAWLNQRK
jgi:glycerol uptake facilitator-like aquaporin